MLLQPTTLSEAVRLVAEHGAPVVAGGTDLMPALVDRPPPALLVDLQRVEELRGIAETPDGWRIGAATTWSEILRAGLPGGFDGLKAAAREVGSRQIQSRATIGGNLCNASPAADGVPPLLALGASLELAGPAGRRRLPLADFLLGNRRTARRPGELLAAILVPPDLAQARSVFLKLGARRYLVISIVMVAASLAVDDRGRIRRAGIAVGAASAVACRLTGLERRLAGTALAEAAGVLPDEADLAGLAPIDDVRATARYRREAAAILVGRALARCAEAPEHA